MGRWVVIFLALSAPAAGQSLEQYQNRQALEQSRQGVQAQAARRDMSTGATVNQRMEGLRVQQQIQVQRQMVLPGVAGRPPLR